MTSYPDVSLLHVSTAFREIKYKKQFFQTRKKSAFCLKLTYALFEKMYEVQKNTIFDFLLFLNIKDNSSKIGFSMTSYPDVSLLHVSTTFRAINYKKQFFQTRKKLAFCLKLTCIPSEKITKLRKLRFLTFHMDVRTALIDFPFDRRGPFAWPALIK